MHVTSSLGSVLARLVIMVQHVISHAAHNVICLHVRRAVVSVLMGVKMATGIFTVMNHVQKTARMPHATLLHLTALLVAK